jgi:WD40 repeat protein
VGVYRLTIHPDGGVFAAAAGDGIRIYDARTFSLIQKINAGRHIYAAAFSPQGDCLAAAHSDAVTVFDQ